MTAISFVGTGFIGLVGAACFAKKGYLVYASSHDREKIEKINNGEPPFYETGLKELLVETRETGLLTGVVGRREAILNTDITFITVGTPMMEDKSADLQYIKQSVKDIGNAIKEKNSFHLVVARSTIPPGTTRNLIRPILEEASGLRAGKEFGLCMNPEFLREGEAVYDTLNPDRVVIGEYNEKSGDILQQLYQEFYREREEDLPILRMSLENAELVKYASNSLLATKISFANEVANICEKVPGADVDLVMKGVGLDWRINPRFLGAGVGWGGSCFPKDVNALVRFATSIGYDPLILKAILAINEYQTKHIVEWAKNLLGGLQGKKIGILGLAFKPNTDDMREAPSKRVIKHLIHEGAIITAYDPIAEENARRDLGSTINYAGNIQEALNEAECCLIITEWDEFKEMQSDNFSVMKRKLIIDGRACLKHVDGSLEYYAIGKSPNKI